MKYMWRSQSLAMTRARSDLSRASIPCALPAVKALCHSVERASTEPARRPCGRRASRVAATSPTDTGTGQPRAPAAATKRAQFLSDFISRCAGGRCSPVCFEFSLTLHRNDRNCSARHPKVGAVSAWNCYEYRPRHRTPTPPNGRSPPQHLCARTHGCIACRRRRVGRRRRRVMLHGRASTRFSTVCSCSHARRAQPPQRGWH